MRVYSLAELAAEIKADTAVAEAEQAATAAVSLQKSRDMEYEMLKEGYYAEHTWTHDKTALKMGIALGLLIGTLLGFAAGIGVG